ncbi:MAG TPA: hypothetical protein ENN38_04090 [Actinobacteria bacterium]|nr:hypothetical protein [Actinomycetota bacterium]
MKIKNFSLRGIKVGFLKKELLDIFVTYKIWVVLAVFLFFALMSPPVAKLAPEIVGSLSKTQGITIEIPTPTIIDSFAQYFKNLSQIGILAVILLSIGLVAGEKTKGTLQLVVTKPVSRANVVISKFLAQTFLFTGSMVVGAAICYLYTISLFEGKMLAKFLQANLLYIIFYILLITITLFFSTIFRSQIAAAGLSVVGLTILTILPGLHEVFAKYSSASLLNIANKIIYGKASFSEATWPIIVSIILIISLLALGIFIFNRQEL